MSEIMKGREKETIHKPVNRVVCTMPQHMEVLRILKATGKIAGVPTPHVDWDTNFFPEFKNKTKDGVGWWANAGKILKLKPDVVLLPAVPGPWGVSADELQKKLEGSITVLPFTFNQPKTFSDELKEIAHILDKEEEAEEFIGWYERIKNSILDVTGKIKDEDRPGVYVEWTNCQVADEDDELISMAGGKDIFAGSGQIEVSKEEIMNKNPEVVIRVVWVGNSYGRDAKDTKEFEELRKRIMERAELRDTRAVKRGKVYIITSDLWTYLPYSGCRHLIGLCYLAKWFHPELFEDIDPEAVHQEYLTRFQGLDIDLNEKGVFVYPKA
ncbi:ABC transporter substrate-binding protein [Methanophagales archaeon]|nr:MAG: ABC transporter substrate-binding protein [Methanophagales archaeon]